MAAVCARLGFWQLDRLSQRRAFNEQVRAGLEADPASLRDTLAAAADPGDVAYRRVRATGAYDPTHEVVLYGRALDGRPGDHILTPLVLDDGTAIVVDRGWVPFEANRELPVPGGAAAPAGPVTVEGFLEPPDDASPPGDDAVTTIRRIDLELLQGQLPYELAPLALQLESQSPAQAALPVPAPGPELSEGPHLSYAIQWFAFATIALGGSALILRRERHDDRRVAEAGPASSTERGS